MEYKLIKLPPDVKAKWVEALRSGKYKQARSILRKQIEGTEEYGYCCMGVLCEVVAPDYNYNEAPSYPTGLPKKIQDSIDSYYIDSFRVDAVRYWLSDMNDQSKKDFNEIADWIEANL